MAEGEAIIKFHAEGKDFYLMFSLDILKPLIEGLPLDQFKQWFSGHYYWPNGKEDFEKDIEQANRFGQSYVGFTSIDGLLRGNKAGDNNEELTRQQIIDKYCLRKA